MVSVLFKLAKRYQIDVLQAITWNFSVSAILLIIINRPHITLQTFSEIFIYPYIALGTLLPILFLMIAASIRINGIVLTTIVERLALFIPLVISYIIFNGQLNNVELSAIVLCVFAILFIISWKRTTKKSAGGWMYLLATFVCLGVSLILFRQVAQNAIPNTTSLLIVFTIAFIVSLMFLVVHIARKKTRFSWPHILIGWVMGFAFFGYITFNLQIHQAMNTQPRAAFSALNVGIITLAMMVGLFIFNERLTYFNKVGIFLALVAIIVIANTDIINAF
ncbi:MAG: EamA/RhaT family transporter [Sphingobacteriaceae bacterium]|nr:MAG: EamA/RhaT family transporter [Sphingobacteriaceae bacterium]